MSRAERAHRRSAQAAFRSANNLVTLGGRTGSIRELASRHERLLQLVGSANHTAVSVFLFTIVVTSLRYTRLHKEKGAKSSNAHLAALDAFSSCFAASLERGGALPEGGLKTCNQAKVRLVIEGGTHLDPKECCGIHVSALPGGGAGLKPLVKTMGALAKRIGSDLKRVRNFVVNQPEVSKAARRVLSCAASEEHSQEGIVEALHRAAAEARSHESLGRFWNSLETSISSQASKASTLCARTPEVKGHDCARPEKPCRGGKRARSPAKSLARASVSGVKRQRKSKAQPIPSQRRRTRTPSPERTPHVAPAPLSARPSAPPRRPQVPKPSQRRPAALPSRATPAPATSSRGRSPPLRIPSSDVSTDHSHAPKPSQRPMRSKPAPPAQAPSRNTTKGAPRNALHVPAPLPATSSRERASRVAVPARRHAAR